MTPTPPNDAADIAANLTVPSVAGAGTNDDIIDDISEVSPEALADQLSIVQQTNISPLYYFFRDLLNVGENGGRTAGRKFGVVQEIVVRKLLEQSELVNERLLFERALPGFSGASHKVEFVLYALQKRLHIGEHYSATGLTFELFNIDAHRAYFRWSDESSARDRRSAVRPRFEVGKAFKDALRKRHTALLFRPGTSYVSVLDINDVLGSIESKRVGAQVFSGSDLLGSGIQTIEKAKQTSLVAIDADLQFNRLIRPILKRDRLDPEMRRYISIVTLGNGVHWTDNDHAILSTYVDHTYLVRDDVMMRYGRYVADEAATAGEPVSSYFFKYFQGMTKAVPDEFKVVNTDLDIIESDDDVRSLRDVLEDHLNKHNLLPEGTDAG